MYNWVTDRDNSINIDAPRMDVEMDGMASGLSNCITRDGQSTVTNDIPMNSNTFTGLGPNNKTLDIDEIGATAEFYGVMNNHIVALRNAYVTLTTFVKTSGSGISVSSGVFTFTDAGKYMVILSSGADADGSGATATDIHVRASFTGSATTTLSGPLIPFSSLKGSVYGTFIASVGAGDTLTMDAFIRGGSGNITLGFPVVSTQEITITRIRD